MAALCPAIRSRALMAVLSLACMRFRRLSWIVPAILLLTGCSTVRDVLGIPNAGDPSVTLRSAEPRWLLIKNPRFGDVPSEPEAVLVTL